jgi:hypothetical protein
LKNQPPENIDEVIAYAVSHNADFHQFMLYTPILGTPLYDEYKKNRTLFSDIQFPVEDSQGQYRFNYRHQIFNTDRKKTFSSMPFDKFLSQRSKPRSIDQNNVNWLGKNIKHIRTGASGIDLLGKTSHYKQPMQGRFGR